MKWLAGVVLIFTSTVASASARAGETTFTYSAELTFVSSYVWRGQRFSTDAVEPLAQPYVEVGADPLGPGTLAVGLWTSRALTEDQANQELDPYASYAVAAGPLVLKASYAVYMTMNASPVDTMHEIALQATSAWELPVTLMAGVAVDPIRTDGWYAFGGAKRSFAVGDGAVEASLNVGGSDYAGIDLSLQDVTATARASYPVGSGAYLALSGSSTWSGRDHTSYHFAGLGVGVTR
jgi:hypothetical protein